MLNKMPDVLKCHKSLVEGRKKGPNAAIYTSIFYDWKYGFQQQAREALLKGYINKNEIINKKRRWGSDLVKIGTQIVRKKILIPYLCKILLLTGEIRNDESTVVVKKTQTRKYVEIASHEKIDKLFTIDGLHAFKVKKGILLTLLAVKYV